MDERIFLALTYIITFGILLYMQIRLPKISRRDIFLGVKIPEDKLKDKNILDIYSRFKKSNYIIGGLALIPMGYLSYVFSQSVLFIILIPFIYLIILFLIYLKYNREVKELKAKEGWQVYSILRMLD